MSPEELLASYTPLAPRFDLVAFCGVWSIVRTNLALWQKRRNPQISYTLLPGDGPVRVHDVVSYTQASGRSGRITGVDQQDSAHPRFFRWRGDRWYSACLTSEWCVVDHDPGCAAWAVTYFSATPVTAAGMDIYARTPTLDEATLTMILERLASHPALQPHVAGLFATRQT